MAKYLRNDVGEYVCPHCPFTAKPKNPSTMYYHLKKHTGETAYACPECDKTFIQKSGLTQHLAQTHALPGSTTFVCPFCEHTARSKANIMIHIGRCHGSAEKNGWFPAPPKDCSCQNCSKSFSSTGAYYYHAMGCYTPPAEVATLLEEL